MKAFSKIFFAMVFLASHLALAQWKPGQERWEFNRGPDPSTPEGRALIDLRAELPEYMALSDALMEDQKFRYIFGMMMTRTYFDKNAVKIFFIGQDATHIAEAAKQPGTSGFGARVQSIGNFFGVDQGVSTSNAFLSTIKGQYGAFDNVFVRKDPNGNWQISQSAYVDNEFWLIANHKDSEITIKREQFWEWMIKNNPESMKLMVLFGGAARDAWAEFLIKRGFEVGTRFSAEDLKNIKVPESRLVYAGGNNEFPVPLNKEGKDIYQILVGRKLDYSKPEEQELAVKTLKAAGQKAIDMMVFTEGGINGSGIVNAAQLGGYDLNKVTYKGQKVNSIKGMVLSDGFVVQQELAFVQSAHPSALSRMTPKEASAALKKSLESLKALKDKGWYIEPDLDDNGKPRVNAWHEGKDYSYGRADIRQGYFEFGAPDDRRVSRADASRLDPQTIVAGSRDRVKFDANLIAASKAGLPSEQKDPNDLFSDHPRGKESRYIFDRGPSDEIAKKIMLSLDRDLIFKPKPGKQSVDSHGVDVTFENNGIDAYNTKTHPGTGLFGIHRGSFETSRALILADPHGIDDWITSRALTGARGQYLNGMMNDIGYGADYLVLKTVPVGMDGATAEEWEVTRKNTEKYREVAIEEALKNKKIEIIFTDGDIAQKEMSRILKKMGVNSIKVINIKRDGMKADSGLVEAAQEAKPGVKITAKMRDIPLSHLTYWARTWEGTGGDRVIDAIGKHRGGVRALVAPDWVAKQKVIPSARVLASILKLSSLMDFLGLRIEKKQSVPAYLDTKLKKVNLPAGAAQCRSVFAM